MANESKAVFKVDGKQVGSTTEKTIAMNAWAEDVNYSQVFTIKSWKSAVAIGVVNKAGYPLGSANMLMSEFCPIKVASK